MTGRSITGVQQVPDNETDRYGIVSPSASEGRLYKVDHFVEKPEQGTAPSNLAILGRYILTPDIFKYLDKHHIGAGGEIQLTDALQMLNEEQDVYAYDFSGTRYDVGEKFGFVKTTLAFALKDETIGADVAELIEELALKTPVK
ncbi:UTP--glucose-1-phosphate uridylyltransferase [Lentibacillus sp. JNUCC-1]|nr:UTP--glucose-1-phosphate uridylyltransferase [Lentibacillus sp. JNUCC-1]